LFGRLQRVVGILFVCCSCSSDDRPTLAASPDQDDGGAADGGAPTGGGGELPQMGGAPAQSGMAAGQATAEAGEPAVMEPDRQPPRLVSSEPTDADDNVASSVKPRLFFSEPIMLTTGALVLRQVQPAKELAFTATLSKDQRSLELTLDESPDVPSELVLEVGSGITDLAGNALEPSSLRFGLPIWQRLGAELNRDTSVSATDVRLARGDASSWVMASVEGGDVYASHYAGGSWQTLGPRVNRGSVEPSAAHESRLALTVDASDAPLVAFREDGKVVARRWDGSIWESLGDAVDPLGGGSHAPALALSGGGDPVVAFDASDASSAPILRVRRLNQATWQTLADIPVKIDGVRLVDDGQAFTLAYHAPGSGLTVSRWVNGALVALGAGSALEDPSRGFALSADDAGAFAVSAPGAGSAVLSGGSWQVVQSDLGFLSSSAAADRSLSHDSAGALLAAFSEASPAPSAARVFVQRRVGGRFMPLGPALNRDPLGAATQPALSVDDDGVPVVAFLETPDGAGPTELYAARYNGDPAHPPTGLGPVAHSAGCLAEPPVDGSRLVESGCFADAQGRKPVAGFVPFDVESPLWSDGAAKRRFFMLPEGATITYRDPGIWTFPPGSILIKEFSLEARRGDPSSVRPVETRFLVVRASGDWDRYSYQWNQDATDAVLRPAAPATPLVEFAVEDEQGMPVAQTHFYPNRAQCLSCHQTPGTVLGLQTAMLNRNFDYGFTIDNQLRSLAQAGVFGASFASTSLEQATFMPNPADTTYTTEARLRSYLHANCSSCHHPLEGLDLRIQTTTLQTGLCSKITKGSVDDSLLYWRDVQRGNVGQPGVAPMPPLGTLVANPLLEPLITDWIVDPQNPCP
jgi:hypothetical protein